MNKETFIKIVTNGEIDDTVDAWESLYNSITGSTSERAITLYTRAIGDAELPEETWKKIADVNRTLLRNNK